MNDEIDLSPNTEEDRRVHAIVDAASKLPPNERLPFVLRCAKDDFVVANAALERLAKFDPDSTLTRKDESDARVSLHAGPASNGEYRVLENLKDRDGPTTRYDLKGEVGRGGMGVVFRVFDRDLRRNLAMKVLLENEPNRLARFLEEAQITGQLDHPNIVPVHELGIDAGGRVFFTMKLVKGETLNTICERIEAGPCEWNTTRVLSAILRVCEAMAFAHEKGVIHRDLKPANIMLGRFGEVFVMDWGLAHVRGEKDHHDLRLRADESLGPIRTDRRETAAQTPASPLATMDGDVVGTPAFMAPEQARGLMDRLGPHTDVYAVGAILYRLLAGVDPYGDFGRRLHSREILARALAGPPRPIESARRGVAPELLAIQAKAMAREIADRYPTMIELANDLRAYLEQRVVRAYATGAIAETRQWIRRNPTLAAAVGTLILVLAIGSAVVWKQKDSVDAKNREIAQQKAVAESRTQEFDQLSGVVLLEAAIDKANALVPPWPERIRDIEAWLERDAAPLLEKRVHLDQTLAELESRALPWTEEQRAFDLAHHPRSTELEAEKRKRLWLVLRAEFDANAPKPLPSLSPDLRALSAQELTDFALPNVQSDINLRVYGDEPMALVAAREAVKRVEAGDDSVELGYALRVLALAEFANGYDDEAMSAMERAIESAPPQKLANYQRDRNVLAGGIKAVTKDGATKRLAPIDAKIAEWTAEVEQRRTWTFDSEADRFLHQTLTNLREDIAEFELDVVKRVERRLDWARRVDDLTRAHPNAPVGWDQAREAIAAADDVVASSRYAEVPIDLIPQPGLVPIGMNPVTKLWEFYELRSACDFDAGEDPAAIKIPTHAADGSIAMGEKTGIVFVLVPGGSFHQGAQNRDARLPNFDGFASATDRLQRVQLAPFFLARHEMTSGQWKRLTGLEPSKYQRGLMTEDPVPVGWSHPVNQVSWIEADSVLRAFGMALPTEARWEYGARGGSTTTWWTGSEPTSLEGAANVLDLRAAEAYPNWGSPIADFDDGFLNAAPAGSYRANSFGLHDMHGNVFEWTLDESVWPLGRPRPDDGLRESPAFRSNTRVVRGGAYLSGATETRSAARQGLSPETKQESQGLRAARDLRDSPRP